MKSLLCTFSVARGRDSVSFDLLWCKVLQFFRYAVCGTNSILDGTCLYIAYEFQFVFSNANEISLLDRKISFSVARGCDSVIFTLSGCIYLAILQFVQTAGEITFSTTTDYLYCS